MPTLKLVDSVNFENITAVRSILSLKGNSFIIISGVVQLSHNHVHTLINLYNSSRKYIIIKNDSILNFSHNKVWSLFDTNLPTIKYPYSFCLFQYFITNKASNLLIEFNDNQSSYRDCYHNMAIMNCRWLPNSSFSNIILLEVNNRYMQFINNSGTYKLSQIIEQSSLCVCTDELHYDCHINDLGYLYPGQTLTVSLYHHKADTAEVAVVKTDITQQYVTPCTVLDISENLQLTVD